MARPRDTSRTARLAIDRVVCREALAFARSLPDACCDLIYVDPPFFTGSLRTARGRVGFADRWTGGLKQYLAFLHPHWPEFRRLLAPHGSLWVHLDWHAAHYVKIQLDTVFGYDNFLNEIIWHYRTGGVSRRWFGRKHDTILAYARTLGRHRFDVLRGGRYRTDGLNLDGHRPYKSTRRGRLYFHPAGPALTDVWDIPFLSTVSLERCGWPTQKPLALLERIISAATRPGDLVADFFCGSGTTLIAARRLRRHWLGCDAARRAVQLSTRRLRSAASKSPPPLVRARRHE
ncbi:MAG: site-specific DNA-methyltransferase [Phycisphaerae bacterium]|nr:site-specific DNA-methyltransferase [Phycisphaerae bacterium]